MDKSITIGELAEMTKEEFEEWLAAYDGKAKDMIVKLVAVSRAAKEKDRKHTND